MNKRTFLKTLCGLPFAGYAAALFAKQDDYIYCKCNLIFQTNYCRIRSEYFEHFKSVHLYKEKIILISKQEYNYIQEKENFIDFFVYNIKSRKYDNYVCYYSKIVRYCDSFRKWEKVL